MKSYLFILGNSPALSVAEILNKFQPKKYSLINKEVFRVDFEEEIDAQKVIKKLGGVIKIVRLVDEILLGEKPPRSPFTKGGGEKVESFSGDEDSLNLLGILEKYLPENFEGKFKFGFSFYGEQQLEGVKKLAMDIKRELKAREISCRWIISKGKSLSSVVVTKNKLVEKGLDFVIVGKGKEPCFLGITKAVQDFEELSFRDYNRPARDSQSGMIPPKLAQMMLNIGLQGKTSNKTLLDPFCGSGTMLMEAGLLGIEKIIGTDVSEKAVKNSQKNLDWAVDNFNISSLKSAVIKQVDVVRLSQFVKLNSVDLIVTEPYLGPQKKTKNIEKAKRDLENLYSKALIQFKRVLKKEGRVVMIWPVLRKAKEENICPNFNGFKIVKQIPNNLELETTKRGGIIYGRKGQRVWREIVVLELV